MSVLSLGGVPDSNSAPTFNFVTSGMFYFYVYMVFLCVILQCKESAYNAGDLSLIPGSGRSAGEGNGNHSSTIAWKIPWIEEPGRLQSMGSQRAGHD